MADGGASSVARGANVTSLSIVGWLEDRIIRAWFELSLPAGLCSVGVDTEIPDPCAKSNLYDAMAEEAMKLSTQALGVM